MKRLLAVPEIAVSEALSNAIFGLLFLALAVIVLAGCATVTPATGGADSPTTAAQTLAQLYARAEEAREQGQFPRAMLYYSEILKRDPDHQKALTGLGKAHLAQDDPGAAITTLSQVVSTHPRNAEAREWRGLSYLRQQDYQNARADLERAVELDPQRWRAWNGLGFIHDLAREGEAAQSHYRKALAILPGHPSVINNLGYSLIISRKYGEAEQLLREGLKTSSDSKRIRNNLAISVASQKRYTEAVDILSQILESAEAHNNVGYLAMLHGDLEVAKMHFETALKLSPKFYARAAENLDEVQRRFDQRATNSDATKSPASP